MSAFTFGTATTSRTSSGEPLLLRSIASGWTSGSHCWRGMEARERSKAYDRCWRRCAAPRHEPAPARSSLDRPRYRRAVALARRCRCRCGRAAARRADPEDVRALQRLRRLAPARSPADRPPGLGEGKRGVRATRHDDSRPARRARGAATFFVAGITADRHPGALPAVAARGHEVACHGYVHRRVFRQTPDEFRQVVLCLDVVQEHRRRTPAGYRAPWFSITRDALWASTSSRPRLQLRLEPLRLTATAEPAAADTGKPWRLT